ncbi:glycoside hydrolase family 3 N-terminal domain-containing protein [Tessaracoccus massiliensis]|uniref:glycoside hydrolase family 3 N-terminal domain-containing protein n=1 Tax=Tessaracoccus massiliensis TaxID=1522311 RepID=UPI0006947066|nr:glycoside hydrolase family 3 N-terminal domain-containing protein [Tessaracoccus massiliensis]
MRRALLLLGAAALGLSACATEPLVPPQYRSAEPAVESVTPSPSGRTAQDPTPDAGEAVTETTAAADACRVMAEELTIEEQVGQLFMVGVNTKGADPRTQSAIRDSKIGSVVLLGNTDAGSSAIRRLTAELGSLGTARLPLLVAVDQEGGSVQRLKGEGFSTIPAARDQGAMGAADLSAAAFDWANELKMAGVHYDLAPVADIVPEAKRASNEPIGKLKRDYGSDPAAVSESVVAFIDGMRQAGVATSVKHFPGLGEVTTNTDFGAAEDNDVTRDSPHLEPFRAAIDARVDSVMISSAVFTQLDPDNEGVFSSAIITDLLRGDLGYDGVVIADDLGAAEAVKTVAPADRAARFIEAGGDIVINANPGIMREMVTATLDAAAADEAFEAQVLDAATRVLRLKSTVGLVTCG